MIFVLTYISGSSVSGIAIDAQSVTVVYEVQSAEKATVLHVAVVSSSRNVYQSVVSSSSVTVRTVHSILFGAFTSTISPILNILFCIVSQ